MGNSNPLIKLNGISKRFDREVLRIESLSLEKGKIYGIIGPSGAGKSTLLRLINLLAEPNEGTILYDGFPAPGNGSGRLALQRRMTLVTQKPLLFKSTVRENIAYGLKARGWRREAIEPRVGALLEKVGLQELGEQRADTLSGGEAQRVALARAVACEPDLLLLDEPTANLDPANVELIEGLILDLNRTAGMTVVMVTHNTFQARRIAHEVIFLYEGRVVEMEKADKLFSAPADPRTRAFVEGRMVY